MSQLLVSQMLVSQMLVWLFGQEALQHQLTPTKLHMLQMIYYQRCFCCREMICGGPAPSINLVEDTPRAKQVILALLRL